VVGDDHAELAPGDVFLPRGQAHGVRAAGAGEVRVVRVAAVPDPSASVTEPTEIRSASGPATWVRRVVAGVDAVGKPGVVQDGDPAVLMVVGDEAAPLAVLADIWELGGQVVRADGGGDVDRTYELEPRGGGGKLLYVRLAPVEPHIPQDNEGWHATSTIDVDIVIAGSVHMYLPDLAPVELAAGDVLLQRGTNHLWQAVGDRPLQMITVMLGVGG
jgi:quercetin dioxygenase-like cupin family protein